MDEVYTIEEIRNVLLNQGTVKKLQEAADRVKFH